MTWLYPGVLLMLLPLAAAAAWLWPRSGRRVAFPFDVIAPPPPRLLDRALSFGLRAAALLPTLVAGMAVVLLAQPQRAVVGPNEREARQVHFMLDGSGSMVGPFGDTTRTLAATDAMLRFVNARDGDAFALTLYAGDSVTWLPLTTDARQFEVAAPLIHPSKLPSELSGSTETGEALETVCDRLEQAPPGERLIILLTDGFADDLDEETTVRVASRLRQQNAAVYTVLVSGDEPPPNAGLLSELTGGADFTAGDPAALAAVFARIDQMSETTFKPTSTTLQDDFGPICLLPLAGLTLYVLAQCGLRYTPW